MMTVPPLLRRGLPVLGLLLAAGAARAETASCPCPARVAATPMAAPSPAAAAPCPCPAAGAAAPSAPLTPARVSATPLPSFSLSERYTAQRKPRVAVLDFDDTNKDALGEVYKDSVEAMLVTFLKRKSQFVVVERQKLGDIVDEWKLRARTNLLPQDPGARELFEKIDALLEGSITLLHAPSTVKTADGKLSSGGDGIRVEIDVKALGRTDGRIIAAAHSSGPAACLRAIVERLGVALEQEFLRPYYGQLQFQIAAPSNVRLFLTPILLDTALDVEKPPVEHGESVLIEPDHDVVEPWTTKPNSYTIQNRLAGWYTARLERPGYAGVGISNGNEDWVARELGGKVQILYRGHDDPVRPLVPLTQAPEELRRFVIYIQPRETQVLLGDDLGFGRKLGGSIAPVVRRQYLDSNFKTPRRVILIGKDGLAINQVERPREYAEDKTCDLFGERLPPENLYGRTYVAPGETFNFDTFEGGELIIEDYRGETVPAGQYQIAFWEPNYQIQQGGAVVNDGDQKRQVSVALTRLSVPLEIETTGPRLPYRLMLSGKETGNRPPLLLAPDQQPGLASLPVDRYVASTDIPGLRGWRREIDLLPPEMPPPVYDQALDEKLQEEARKAKAENEARRARGEEAPPAASEEKLPMPIRPAAGEEPVLPKSLLRAKTRLCVGGRLTALSSLSLLDSDDICIDPEIASLLERAFESEPSNRKQPPRKWWMLRRRAGSDEEEEALEVEVAAAPRLLRHPARAAALPGPAKPSMELDPDEAREQLAERLSLIDLLVLDDRDMGRLRENSEAASVVAQYLAQGGTLFAFVSRPGDYREVVGAPLVLAARGRRTSRFLLAPGEVPGVGIEVGKKRVRIGGKRRLLHLEESSPGWRVVAFTTAGKGARILERGERGTGGHVVLWLDRPSLFRSRLLRRRIPAIEQNRARVEKLVLERTRTLSARRYDAAPEETRQAAQAAGAPEERLKQLAELLRQGLITRAEYDSMRAKVLGGL